MSFFLSEVKCCRHLPKSRVLSCLRFERCFFFQKYLWFLAMEHKQLKCAPEKKKVAVPAPIVQRKQNPTSNFLEDCFIALIGLSRKFWLPSWNNTNFVNACPIFSFKNFLFSIHVLSSTLSKMLMTSFAKSSFKRSKEFSNSEKFWKRGDC